MALTTRLQLQARLEELLGSRNVYYQPPETLKMLYPCLVYNPQSVETVYANDDPYMTWDSYLVTSITKEAEDPMLEVLRSERGFAFDRHFVADNLHHNVFRLTIY